MLFSISHCEFYGTRFATTHDKQSPPPIAMAASSFPPEPISGKIIHVISAHYIFYTLVSYVQVMSLTNKLHIITRLKRDITWWESP